jgi:phosphoglucosamine mutase
MTTPGVAFITRWNEADLGVAISASHASYEYNGIKLVDRHGLRLQREDELEIEALIRTCLSQGVKSAKPLGQETPMPDLMIDLYIQDHVKRFADTPLDGLCVVLDCAEGAASRVAPQVFERLGARVIAVNDNAEGANINHECGSEHVRECPDGMVECIHKHGAEYGYAFDGDGDRLVVVDTTGHAYDGFDLLFALARYYHSRGLLRQNVVVTERRANRGLEASLRRYGIKTVYTKNGDRNLEKEMWGEGYLLGSEAGGNFIINDGYHSVADAVYAALVLSRALVESRPETLGDLVAPLHRHPQSKHSINLRNSPLTPERRAELEQLREQKQEELGAGSRIDIWDSTTEPGTIRILVEGYRECSQARVDQIADDIIECISPPTQS